MSDEDGSVGHPEQTLDSKSGAIIDAFFNLNPEKFGPMPAVEFLDRVRQYQRVNDEFEQAKKALLQLEEKKKQLEDDARKDDGAADQLDKPATVPVPVPPYNESVDEPSAEQPDQPAESANEQPEEAPVNQTPDHHNEQPPQDQPVDANSEYPQISKVTSDYI